MTYSDIIANRTRSMTSQTAPIPGREASMVGNRAGGFSFKVTDTARLRRFLVLGSDSPTYYASAREMTLDNASSVVDMLERDGIAVVYDVVEVSVRGLAPKNDAALFVLAMAASFGARARSQTPSSGKKLSTVASRLVDSENPSAAAVRRAALEALPSVARIAPHLYLFMSYLTALRGVGMGVRKLLAEWFDGMSDEKLALQAVKYQARNGWTLRDVLRLAHVPPSSSERSTLVDWVVHRDRADTTVAGKGPRKAKADVIADARRQHSLIDGFHLLREACEPGEVAAIVSRFSMPRECVPTEFLTHAVVWEALLNDMPMTAMIRNLGNMSAAGILHRGSEGASYVARRLCDPDELSRARIHPFNVLVALRTYAKGGGLLGSKTWQVNQTVSDALQDAFYTSFGFVERTGARKLLGIDVSGSMSSPILSGGRQGVLTAREAAAAMAMVSFRLEADAHAYGFTRGDGGLTDLNLSRNMTLKQVCNITSSLRFGGTDASLPVKFATERRIPVDVFEIYTDNESYGGVGHVTQWLDRYRQKTGIPAKLVSVAFSATEYSVADASDPGQLDIVGFDASAPAVMADFASGGAVSATQNNDGE